MRTTSSKGIALIKKFEGFRAKAYKPHPNDVWTIGYGHTSGVRAGDRVTKEEAEQLLRDDLQWSEAAVNQHVRVDLHQSQFDTLVSFVFNIGESQFVDSTLLKELNRGRYDRVDHQLMRWIYSSGKKFEGLIRRRRAEAEMFIDMAPRFISKGAMPQSVECEAARTVTETVKESRTAKSGAGVAGVGGIDLLGKLNEASTQAGGIAANLGGTLTEPGILVPLLLLGVGGYIIYLKFSDRRNGRSY